MNGERQRWLVPLLIGAVVLLADQASKIWIRQTLGPVPLLQQIGVVDDWLNIIYSRNTGVAFGLFQNMSPIFALVAVLITIGAIYSYIVYLPNNQALVQISIGLIVGGALGNVIDRILLGYVVDFIQVGWWPVFNLADSAIMVGATLLAVHLLLTPEDEPPPANPQDEALLDDLLRRTPDTPAEHPIRERDSNTSG